VTSEKDLLRKAHSFDPDALAEIYDSYSPGIYRYAFRLLGEQDLAEDCLAETLSRFLLALKNNGGPREHLQAYLYRIAHNYITDQYRRKEQWEHELTEAHPDLEQDMRASLNSRIDENKLRHALSCLTPDQRQVVVLKFIEGMDNRAIARSIGKPISAVKSLQHRALAALRRMLKNELEEE